MGFAFIFYFCLWAFFLYQGTVGILWPRAATDYNEFLSHKTREREKMGKNVSLSGLFYYIQTSFHCIGLSALCEWIYGKHILSLIALGRYRLARCRLPLKSVKLHSNSFLLLKIERFLQFTNQKAYIQVKFECLKPFLVNILCAQIEM